MSTSPVDLVGEQRRERDRLGAAEGVADDHVRSGLTDRAQQVVQVRRLGREGRGRGRRVARPRSGSVVRAHTGAGSDGRLDQRPAGAVAAETGDQHHRRVALADAAHVHPLTGAAPTSSSIVPVGRGAVVAVTVDGTAGVLGVVACDVLVEAVEVGSEPARDVVSFPQAVAPIRATRMRTPRWREVGRRAPVQRVAIVSKMLFMCNTIDLRGHAPHRTHPLRSASRRPRSRGAARDTEGHYACPSVRPRLRRPARGAGRLRTGHRRCTQRPAVGRVGERRRGDRQDHDRQRKRSPSWCGPVPGAVHAHRWRHHSAWRRSPICFARSAGRDRICCPRPRRSPRCATGSRPARPPQRWTERRTEGCSSPSSSCSATSRLMRRSSSGSRICTGPTR